MAYPLDESSYLLSYSGLLWTGLPCQGHTPHECALLWFRRPGQVVGPSSSFGFIGLFAAFPAAGRGWPLGEGFWPGLRVWQGMRGV